MGYHKTEIKKGKLGTLSKIQEELEELDELRDADFQQVRILMLCELADLVGAIQSYMDSNLPGYTIKDALDMAALTRSAFEDGER